MFSMILWSSAVYRRKRIGPRIDPWGTPQSTADREDCVSL